MSERLEKPGIMLYFDLLQSIVRMEDAQIGEFIRGVVEYSTTGEEPAFASPLCFMWPMIKMRLDRDDERYQHISYKRRYAAYTRWARTNEVSVKSFDEWLSDIAEDA